MCMYGEGINCKIQYEWREKVLHSRQMKTSFEMISLKFRRAAGLAIYKYNLNNARVGERAGMEAHLIN